MRIEHFKSEVLIYKTTNYSLFNRISGNRDINSKKVRKMVSEVANGNNLLPYFPILCTEGKNGKLDIVDGQHRFELAKKCKKDVYYIIKVETMQLDKIAGLNSIQEKWKVADFMQCYIEKGCNDYKELQSFMDKYPFPLSVSLNLMAYGITGTDNGAKENLRNLFQLGKYKVHHKKQAIEIAELCKRFEAFPGWHSRGFIVAVGKLLQKNLCDFDELITKFDKAPQELKVQKSYKEYLVNLEQIYNRNNQKRRAIY